MGADAFRAVIIDKLRGDTSLVELDRAEKQDKPQVVNRLRAACNKLHDLIIHGKLPEA